MNSNLEELLHGLESKGIRFRLIELNGKAVSIDDVIRLSKERINKDEICKTIIIKTNIEYIAVFLKGDSKLDFGKLKAFLGKKARLASVEEVKESTGVDPGAVCPLLLNMPLLVDSNVMDCRNVNFGSGDHMYGIEVGLEDLIKLKNAKIVEASTD